MPTYDPDVTQHKQAAIRCGYRLKIGGSTRAQAQLVDDVTGDVAWEGPLFDSWDWLKGEKGLTAGAH